MYENNICENKYILGITMIIINIGSRFLLDELTASQKKFINRPLIRRLTIFCIFLMASKDILASFILTIIFILLISDIFDGEGKEKEENTENRKILSEIEIILSKYSK